MNADPLTVEGATDTAVTEPLLVYLGTADGLATYRWTSDGIERVGGGADGTVRDISIHPDDSQDAFVGCGLRGWGLHHTTDGGRSVEAIGFEDRWVWGVTRHPTDPETIYVGTEPPELFVSNDGGGTFEAIRGIESLPSRSSWTFFHEPFRAGHVHGIAIHPERPERIFAGVEHGAVLYTHDGGETWNEALVGRDLHRTAIDPDDPDRVLAATGNGLEVSEDAGETWESVEQLRGRYLHAIVFDTDRPDRVYAYADRDGDPLFRSDDGGATWEAIGSGLPAARPADTVRLVPGADETLLYAGDEPTGGDGGGASDSVETSRLYVSPDAGESWRVLADGFAKVRRLEVTPLR